MFGLATYIEDECHFAVLMTGIESLCLTHMAIECNQCGAFDDTREQGMNRSLPQDAAKTMCNASTRCRGRTH